MRKIWIIVLLLIGIIPAQAQQQQDEAVASASTFYDLLLTGDATDFALISELICNDVEFAERQYQALVTSRQDATLSADSLSYEVTINETNANEAILTVVGEPTVTSGAAEAFIPVREMRMVSEDNLWRICPPRFPVRIISVSDQDLTLADAQLTAAAFYVAFYEGDSTLLESLVCSPLVEQVIQGSTRDYAGRTRIEPSNWSASVEEVDGQFLIRTVGTLLLTREGVQISADPLDFPDARMIRENGWKFCEGYRVGEQLTFDFLRGYLTNDGGAIVRNTCRALRVPMLESAAEISLAAQIDQVVAPRGLTIRTPFEEGIGLVSGLQGTFGQLADGSLVSINDIFGDTAELIIEDARWKWCQPTLEQAAEMEETPQ